MKSTKTRPLDNDKNNGETTIARSKLDLTPLKSYIGSPSTVSNFKNFQIKSKNPIQFNS